MTPRIIARLLLTLAGFYDGILGAAFLFAAGRVFSFCGIPAPSHWGYVHFAAALLLVFALMFFSAAVFPSGNRNLIAYGMLLKLAYCATVAYHWFHDGVPVIFTVFFFVDAAWFVLLGWIYYAVRPAQQVSAEAQPTALTPAV